jgi:hypothetical protein
MMTDDDRYWKPSVMALRPTAVALSRFYDRCDTSSLYGSIWVDKMVVEGVGGMDRGRGESV